MRTPVATFAASILMLAAATPCLAIHSPLAAHRSSQAIQNARADAFGLSRMRNREMIVQFCRAGDLVAVPASTSTYYLDDISGAYRYARPWTRLFLDRLSEAYRARFHQRLRITSLVRTTGSQARLERSNGNAAEATGPDRSSHLTGATLDISKRFMSWQGQRWMRHELLGLARAGYLYAIEEFHQPTFHVMVYPTYREYVARLSTRSTRAQAAD